MKQDFIIAVDNHNLASVRMMLSNELLLDPRGTTFAEMLKYAKDNIPDLFEENKLAKFTIPNDKEMWNRALLSKMKSELNLNFSIEKLAIFEEMAKYVGKDKAAHLTEEEKTHEDEENVVGSDMRQKQKSSIRNRKTGVIVTGSGAVIAITGLCVKGMIGTMLTILGGAVVIGGVILLSTTSKDK